MKEYFHAGGDWSGKPEKPNEPFIFCLVVLPDADAWDEACRELRRKLRMPERREFHAHQMSSEQRLEVLKLGVEHQMRVAALIAPATENPNERPSGYEEIALETLALFLPSCALKSAWFDTEIQGKAAHKAFETKVCRFHREVYPGTQLQARVRPSHTNTLIQLADVMAYALRAREMRPRKEETTRQLLERIENSETNRISRWG